MAVSCNEKVLYPMLEGPLTTNPDQHRRSSGSVAKRPGTAEYSACGTRGPYTIHEKRLPGFVVAIVVRVAERAVMREPVMKSEPPGCRPDVAREVGRQGLVGMEHARNQDVTGGHGL